MTRRDGTRRVRYTSRIIRYDGTIVPRGTMACKFTAVIRFLRLQFAISWGGQIVCKPTILNLLQKFESSLHFYLHVFQIPPCFHFKYNRPLHEYEESKGHKTSNVNTNCICHAWVNRCYSLLCTVTRDIHRVAHSAGIINLLCNFDVFAFSDKWYHA